MFARLLLMHLPDPVRVLRTLWNAVAQGARRPEAFQRDVDSHPGHIRLWPLLMGAWRRA